MTARFFIFVSFLAVASFAQGASITQIKGSKALLDMSGTDDARSGDEFYALNSDGKKRAVLRITQSKKGKAIAEIVKGNPEVGQELQLKSAGPAMSRDVRESDMGESDRGDRSSYYGKVRKKTNGGAYGIFGEMINMTMTASFTAGAGAAARKVDAAMKGTSFGVLGFYDFPISRRFQIRASGGLEQLSASGSISNADCESGTSTTCSFSVTYLSVHGAAKFVTNPDGRMRFYLTGSYGFLIAMAKSSNVIATSQISTNQIFGLGAGLEIPVGKDAFIPVALDYGLFPSSDTVKANLLFLRAGYAWPF